MAYSLTGQMGIKVLEGMKHSALFLPKYTHLLLGQELTLLRDICSKVLVGSLLPVLALINQAK